jgi:hypothetical protein
MVWRSIMHDFSVECPYYTEHLSNYSSISTTNFDDLEGAIIEIPHFDHMAQMKKSLKVSRVSLAAFHDTLIVLHNFD